MILLPETHYEKAAPKLKEVTFNNLFARSVVENHVRGRIYVDDVSAPKAFYVIHPYGMSLLYGDVSDGFLQSELKAYLLGRGDLRRAGEWLQVFPLDLENRIDRILGNKLIIFEGGKDRENSDAAVIKH